MAVKNPCASDDEIFNTGVDCLDSMLATYSIYFVPLKDRWTDNDIDGPAGYTNFILSRVQSAPATRWLPLGGSDSEIGDIVEANVADVLETLPNGVSYLVKRGQFARTFKTTKGGLCLAKALFGNNWSKYGFVEVDKEGKILQVVYSTDANGIRTFGPVPLSNAYAPLPELASFTTTYKNLFFISFDPLYYISKSKILKGDRTEDITSISGLLDSEITNFSVPVAASNTAPTTGATTITTLGADGNTIQISINGVDVSGVVTKTSSESTITLLATKVAAAITALASTNGGITAASTVGAITYTVPTSFGSSINGISPVATIVGTIAVTEAAFASGAYGAVTFLLDVTSECSATNLVAQPGTSAGTLLASSYIVKRAGVAVTPAITVVNVSGSPDHIQMVVPASTTATSPAITIDGAAANVLFANGIIGYDIVLGVTY